GRRRVINRQVRSYSSKDRMESGGAKRRRNPRITQRRTQESAPQRLSIPIVIAVSAVAVQEVIRVMELVLGFQFGCQDSTLYAPAVGVTLSFDDHAKCVARLKVREEVDIGFEDLRQIENMLRRQSRFGAAFV